MATAVSVSQFRTDFAVFADSCVYPDPMVLFWLAVADKVLNADRWNDMRVTAIELFVAHQVAIGANDLLAAKRNAIPGMVQGVLTSESVDKVSAAYDASSVTYKDAGFWNMTSYGIQLWYLIQMFGAGPVMIGMGTDSAYGSFTSASGAWPGPTFL